MKEEIHHAVYTPPGTDIQVTRRWAGEAVGAGQNVEFHNHGEDVFCPERGCWVVVQTFAKHAPNRSKAPVPDGDAPPADGKTTVAAVDPTAAFGGG